MGYFVLGNGPVAQKSSTTSINMEEDCTDGNNPLMAIGDFVLGFWYDTNDLEGTESLDNKGVWYWAAGIASFAVVCKIFTEMKSRS